MFKSIFLALIMALAAFGQNVSNNVEYSRSISNFSGDTLRYTSKFNVGDNEGLRVIIRCPVVDSGLFIVKYQRGYVVDGGESNSNGWTLWDNPPCFIDTFNTSVAGNFYSIDSMVDNGGNDSDLVQALDSVQIPGYAVMIKEISTYKSPYGRFIVQGLTGNRVEPYTLIFSVEMNKFYRVETKSQY
jgi:hypothetical protein